MRELSVSFSCFHRFGNQFSSEYRLRPSRKMRGADFLQKPQYFSRREECLRNAGLGCKQSNTQGESWWRRKIGQSSLRNPVIAASTHCSALAGSELSHWQTEFPSLSDERWRVTSSAHARTGSHRETTTLTTLTCAVDSDNNEKPREETRV